MSRGVVEPVVEAPAADSPRARPRWRALVSEARPKQWVKNVLVFAAPGAAGVLSEPDEVGRTLIAFVALCLAASGTYFLNDALDVDADRRHPVKQRRPIAATNRTTEITLAEPRLISPAAMAISAPVNRGYLLLTVVGYIVLSVSDTLWIKHEPVFDIAVVAGLFVIRAIAGGIATDVFISDWFLIVAGAGSLFIVTGKRHAEQIELGDDSSSHRKTLEAYSTAYLNYIRAVASGVAILAYCLWAFERAASTGDVTFFRLSIVPFVLVILRYAFVIDQGKGGAPEDVIMSDRTIQLVGLVWLLCFAVGVHV
jgi:decaprenyl-phosphate phosphoribosyltransferase